MTTLRPAPHTTLDNTVVEVWQDGDMIAVIYPTRDGVQIISKYLNEKMGQPPPAVLAIHIREPKQ